MKNIITTIFFNIFLFSCAASQPNKKLNTDLRRLNIQGNVKSIIETNYFITKKDPTLKLSPKKKTYIFNAKGNLIKIFGDASMSEGSWGKQEFKYDQKERKIECTVYNDDGSLQGKSIFKYDLTDRITEEDRYSQNFPKNGEVLYQGKILYTYDTNGNKTQEEYSSKDENVQGDKTSYEYDSKGNLVKEKTGNHIIIYKYDSKGNVIEQTLEGTTNSIYTYDKKDNWVKRENSQTVNNYTYDEKYITERTIVYY